MVSWKASFDFYVEVRVEVLTRNLNALQKPRVSLKASFEFHVEVRVEVVTQNLNALQKPRVSLQPPFGFHVEVRVGVLTQNSNALQKLQALPKPQWKGHVYFLGGVLYVNILFASPADVHGLFLPLPMCMGFSFPYSLGTQPPQLQPDFRPGLIQTAAKVSCNWSGSRWPSSNDLPGVLFKTNCNQQPEPH